MGNPEQDGTTDGMPDFGAQKGMKDLFDSLSTKPRKERDPNRKVGRNHLYDRFHPGQDLSGDGTPPK